MSFRLRILPIISQNVLITLCHCVSEIFGITHEFGEVAFEYSGIHVGGATIVDMLGFDVHGSDDLIVLGADSDESVQEQVKAVIQFFVSDWLLFAVVSKMLSMA